MDAEEPADADPRITVHADARGEAGPHVRPLGSHPLRPIVRRIGDRDLFLGNRFAADPDECDRRFDAVLTVASEPAPATTRHRPLVDGPAAEWARFRAAVDAARRLDCRDGTLLVHCKAGISRSTAVVATTIACEGDLSLPAAFDEVREHRPHAVAHPRLRELAVCYVAGLGDRPPAADQS